MARITKLLKEHDAAYEKLSTAQNKEFDDIVGFLKERARFFDTLALGCGAAITAIVSFVSAHYIGQRHLLIRWSLISLLVSMFLAILHNNCISRMMFTINAYRRIEPYMEYQEQLIELSSQTELFGDDVSDKQKLVEDLASSERKKELAQQGIKRAVGIVISIQTACYISAFASAAQLVWLFYITF